MKDYLFETNYGHTYKITADIVARDYAETAYQFQEQDGIPEQEWKTQEEITQEIIKDQDWLDQWYFDYIDGDIEYISQVGELIQIDKQTEDNFIKNMFALFGSGKTK